jgi:hypothetical protein
VCRGRRGSGSRKIRASCAKQDKARNSQDEKSLVVRSKHGSSIHYEVARSAKQALSEVRAFGANAPPATAAASLRWPRSNSAGAVEFKYRFKK